MDQELSHLVERMKSMFPDVELDNIVKSDIIWLERGMVIRDLPEDGIIYIDREGDSYLRHNFRPMEDGDLILDEFMPGSCEYLYRVFNQIGSFLYVLRDRKVTWKDFKETWNQV